MPDPTTLPLDELLSHCPPLTQTQTTENAVAWHELERRAFHLQNDAAWDALVDRLWPSVLTWIYAYIPDLPPATAEQLAQQTILALRQQQRRPLSSPTSAADSPQSTLSSQISHILLHLLAVD